MTEVLETTTLSSFLTDPPHGCNGEEEDEKEGTSNQKEFWTLFLLLLLKVKMK